MPWLVHDDKVLATLEVASSLKDRTRGLLGRDGIEGAILLRPARSVHTFRMRFPIDVAFCDDDLVVVKVCTLVPHRVTRPVLSARSVVECEAGMLSRWGVRPGTRLEIRGLDGRAGEASPGESPDRTDRPDRPGRADRAERFNRHDRALRPVGGPTP